MFKKILSTFASFGLLLLVGVVVSPSSAHAATFYDSAYAEAYRIYATCGGSDPAQVLHPCLKNSINGQSVRTEWSFYAYDIKEAGGAPTATYVTISDVFFYDGAATSWESFKNILSQQAPGMTYTVGPNYLEVRPPADSLIKPKFACAPVDCYSNIYISFVPLGKSYNSAGEHIGDSEPNPPDRGVADYGSATNNTNPAPDEGGDGGDGGDGSEPTPICQLHGGAADCATYATVDSMDDCININPLEFKFDVPCLWAFLFVPSDESVSNVNTRWNTMLHERQPFVWIDQLFTTFSATFSGLGGCEPLGYDMPLPLSLADSFYMEFFPCDPRIRDVIRPYSSMACWFLISGAIGTWVWRKVEPSLNAQGGA